MAQARRRTSSKKTKQRAKQVKAPAVSEQLSNWGDDIKRLTSRGVESAQGLWEQAAQRIPLLHMRGLMILIPIVLILLLWPSRDDETSPTSPMRREVAVNIPAPSTSEQATPTAPVEETVRPLQPAKPVPDKPRPQTKPIVTPAEKPQAVVTSGWQQHKIAQGETLATIFRTKGLPLGDLYAIAAIEGEDKPISRVRAGQLIRFRQQADGRLDALQIERANQDIVSYMRLSDGSFFRSNR